MIYVWMGLALLVGCAVWGCWSWQKERYALQCWAVPYLLSMKKRTPPASHQPIDVLLCIADHHEPLWGKPSASQAQARVTNWVEKYPLLFGQFRDSAGRPPRHSFFFPLEEYVADHVGPLAELCKAGFGEIEIHLHHDHDTPENLRRRLLDFKHLLVEEYGQLARHRATGEWMYGFIHGNWALDNCRPDGRWCGVNNELDILRETGCYADFTLPSAPSNTQTWKINSIYYATDDPHKPKSHDDGIDVGRGPQPADSLMLIQGPLVLDWSRRKAGIVPRIENACIQKSQPPSIQRLPNWLRARVQVPTRPDWFFVKLHTHGGPESHQQVLLGEPMVRFHQDLAERADANPNFRYHYVTAREMYNAVKAAESGWTGSVGDALDFELTWNGKHPSPQASTSPGNRESVLST